MFTETLWPETLDEVQPSGAALIGMLFAAISGFLAGVTLTAICVALIF